MPKRKFKLAKVKKVRPAPLQAPQTGRVALPKGGRTFLTTFGAKGAKPRNNFIFGAIKSMTFRGSGSGRSVNIRFTR